MTKFRGCIDIHCGQVKQIVGGTLTQDDTRELQGTSETKENFVSRHPSSYYAELYKESGVGGSHVIKLGSNRDNDLAAKEACERWPYHLQVGGGINYDNAVEWLDRYKASHVILTSWLFSDSASASASTTTKEGFNEGGKVLDFEKLKLISELVGKDRLVVDLSCRRVGMGQGAQWVVAMNKWQTLTQCVLGPEFIESISNYCDEFLVHAADVEGLCRGIDEELVVNLGQWCPPGFEGKIVYAGGAKSVEDLNLVARLSGNKVDLTYGSSLDIFGGSLVKYNDVVHWNQTH